MHFSNATLIAATSLDFEPLVSNDATVLGILLIIPRGNLPYLQQQVATAATVLSLDTYAVAVLFCSPAC